jgi:hypothetical protein
MRWEIANAPLVAAHQDAVGQPATAQDSYPLGCGRAMGSQPSPAVRTKAPRSQLVEVSPPRPSMRKLAMARLRIWPLSL